MFHDKERRRFRGGTVIRRVVSIFFYPNASIFIHIGSINILFLVYSDFKKILFEVRIRRLRTLNLIFIYFSQKLWQTKHKMLIVNLIIFPKKPIYWQ